MGAVGKFLAYLVGLVLGSVTSMLVIGIAWIRYRPVIAFTLLGIAGAIITYVMISKQNHEAWVIIII